MAGRKKISIEERFREKFERRGEDDCWLWIGSINLRWGYGQFRMPDRWYRAHRIAWELFIGAIPHELSVLHKCDNRRCVNPNHLFLGTAKDNSDDCHAKGRGPVATQFKPRLSDETVAEIREAYRPRQVGYLKLAKRFGISAGHVRQLIKRSRRK
jgi:hypothetical protein